MPSARSYTSPLCLRPRHTPRAPLSAPHDPADEAMCARARERYAATAAGGFRRRRKRHAAMPNLIIIGGLKCGTTSIHHYLGLHPEIQMSKPKELNFFVAELNWDLGLDWYASRFDDRFPVRGESSPHYTNLPRFTGVAERIREHCPDARLIYMVRDPIKRILSHWVHATGAGYETARARVDPLAARHRLRAPLDVLDAAAALPRALRPRADRGHHPGGAAGRARGDDAQGLRASPASTRTSAPSSSTASGRSRAPSRATATSSWRS